MKIIKYQLMTEVNHGTEDEPNIVQTFKGAKMQCTEDTFKAAYAMAQKEAYNGEVTVEEVPDPEIPPDEPTVWDDMAAAIEEGVNDV